MKEYFTTTQAAKLLSVSADTVLKWVRAGKIDSYRTPGGHFRIPSQAIETLLPGVKEPDPKTEYKNDNLTHLYCWDFYSDSGCVNSDCQSCVAYRSGARRCYEMRDIPEEFGHLKLHCRTDCSECEYYNIMKGNSTSVLIISHIGRVIRKLNSDKNDQDLVIRFTKNGYDCSLLIEKFRPDYAIIDCNFGESRAKELCMNLINDERIPFTRILVTSQSASLDEYCRGKVFGWIKKPFTYKQLKECLINRELIHKEKM